MQEEAATPALGTASHVVPVTDIVHLAQVLRGVDRQSARDAATLEEVLSRVNAMVAAMLRHMPVAEEPRRPAGLAPWQQAQVRALVERRLHEGISVGDMARAARLSRSFFTRAFKASFGCTPHVYVVGRRVARAKAMMRDTQDSLAQIAAACGLSDQAHLSRQFRQHEACSPSAWRRHLRHG